ncbi:hypothetical protein CCR83_05555 [Rhodobacter veldkampii DSM 11550]|uniref:Ancillary SecYEG translocon subunit/Cell division coordinator CpoB TPR domain-containing protein n=1 Tax=Phaeovulum veldkampii DSM 11550 TaxID=1185920 RepID=A0A2T4JM10_9RHOB|nr:tetratricopeptide repeat protein [Phaeovulum veldkampii]MBK5945931.1 hypothetical protein [Phaeovulum veldkampii DSM 11550]PTE18945.1 hypothetical protein C5F46_01920 [Phaeovulum veldkampii DSM 11550]TDQ64674.1 hypothetical protein EV658_101137 [Phaeovulum veldkampii DSM 11550]
MSETDSFIEEVTEEVRRDRLFKLMRRYGWVGILAMLGIVGGAAYNEWQKARATASAQAFGDAVMAAMEAEDRRAALAAVAGTAPQNALRQFLLAAEAAEAGDAAGARDMLEALAADPALPESLRALARIKAAILAGPDMAPAERDATLAALAAPGAPFRLLALEQQALALLDAGRRDEAIVLSRQILNEAELTPGLRRRATELIVTLGGDPAAR